MKEGIYSSVVNIVIISPNLLLFNKGLPSYPGMYLKHIYPSY